MRFRDYARPKSGSDDSSTVNCPGSRYAGLRVDFP